MTVSISTTPDERLFIRYINMRNAPRDTLTYGVYPNSHKALREYDELVTALTGGDETIDDLSGMATYHANAIASVTPFIQAMQACMQSINKTMHVVNLLAILAGEDKIFLIDPEELTIQDYLTGLQETIDTLTSTVQTTQQIVQSMQG